MAANNRVYGPGVPRARYPTAFNPVRLQSKLIAADMPVRQAQVFAQEFHSTMEKQAVDEEENYRWIRKNISGKPYATVVVAASDSSAADKAKADFVCDGSDDQNEIWEAGDIIWTLPGGKILLLEGNYNCSGYFDLPPNCTLEGMGAGTILNVNFVSGSGYFIGPNFSGEGFGRRRVVRDLRIHQTGGVLITAVINLNGQDLIDNVIITTEAYDGGGLPLIDKGIVLGGSWIEGGIRNCYISECATTGIQTQYGFVTNTYVGWCGEYQLFVDANDVSTRMTIIGNHFDNSNNWGVYIPSDNSGQTVVMGNWFAARDAGAAILCAANACVIVGNYIANFNSSVGIQVGIAGINGVGPLVVADNLITGGSVAGIDVVVGSSTNQHVTITGNTIGANGGATSYGIKIDGDGATHCFFLVDGNHITGVGTYGIYLSDTVRAKVSNNLTVQRIWLTNCDDVSVTDNWVQATGVAGQGAIHLTDDTNTCNVQGNTVRGLAVYGVRVNTADCNDNLVTNNDVKNGYSTAGISDAGTGTIVAAGNRV